MFKLAPGAAFELLPTRDNDRPARVAEPAPRALQLTLGAVELVASESSRFGVQPSMFGGAS